MKKWRLPILLITFLTFISFTSYAEASPDAVGNEAKMLEQVEQKKQLIQQLQNSNMQLESEIEVKGDELDKLLSGLQNLTNEPAEDLVAEFNAKLGEIMKGVIEIDSLEDSISNYLETSDRQIASKNYTEGLNQLSKSIDALNKEHQLLIDLSSAIDSVITFLKSL